MMRVFFVFAWGDFLRNLWRAFSFTNLPPGFWQPHNFLSCLFLAPPGDPIPSADLVCFLSISRHSKVSRPPHMIQLLLQGGIPDHLLRSTKQLYAAAFIKKLIPHFDSKESAAFTRRDSRPPLTLNSAPSSNLKLQSFKWAISFWQDSFEAILSKANCPFEALKLQVTWRCAVER